MTNKQIITNACIENNITESVDTFIGWKRKGYIVKVGNKAVFSTKIWKPKKVNITDKETGQKKTVTKMRLVPASFFTSEQVQMYNSQKISA